MNYVTQMQYDQIEIIQLFKKRDIMVESLICILADHRRGDQCAWVAGLKGPAGRERPRSL